MSILFEVVKPEKDKRKYINSIIGRVNVLFVYDEDTKFDAMALFFSVGSMSTPKDGVGLPHLLEHVELNIKLQKDGVPRLERIQTKLPKANR